MWLCPRSLALALASSIPVLGLERVCSRKGFPSPWPRIFFVSLASSLVSSTPPLVNIAANWALEQELQFSSKKTEIVLFTHKRNPDMGCLSKNGSKLELSKEARLLGVSLDSKLAWRPHITRITRKATIASMQCRQIAGKRWVIKPSMMKWIYTGTIRPIISYARVSWAGGLNKKYLVRKLTKVQRLACLMVSSAFPGTPTCSLEILLNITPIEQFLLAEAVRGPYRITLSGL